MLHTFRLAMFGFGLLGISACHSGSEPNIQMQDGTITTTLPNKIREVARLGTVPLRLRVTVNDTVSNSLPIDNEDTEDVRVVANVPADQSNSIKIEWLAFPNGVEVLLAEYNNGTLPNQQELRVSQYVDSGDGFDYDGDGLTNLQEARENRNILDAIDIPVPLQSTFLGASRELIQGAVDDDTSGDPIDPDSNTTFSLRHDGTNLVLYVCGQDEALVADGAGADNPEQYWHDDTVFVYLDGANSDSTTYDNVDDFQLAFVRETQQLIVSKGPTGHACRDGSCIVHQFYNNSSQCKYELDVTMPLAELNMTPGTEIGFDLEITDDDNGGVREGSSGFVGFDDQSNLHPYTFGTIQLLQ